MKEIIISLEYLGTEMSISVSNQGLLECFEGKEGVLLEFVKLAVNHLKTFDNDIIKMELQKLTSNTNEKI